MEEVAPGYIGRLGLGVIEYFAVQLVGHVHPRQAFYTREVCYALCLVGSRQAQREHAGIRACTLPLLISVVPMQSW